MGIWRNLGYVFAGLNMIAGFILVGIGSGIMSQPNMQQGLPSFGMLNQLGGFALVYGGAGTIVFGILLIWALVKSGQIENIDKNIKIIAEWARLQQEKQKSNSEFDLVEEQKKIDAEENYLDELERKKKEKDEK